MACNVPLAGGATLTSSIPARESAGTTAELAAGLLTDAMAAYASMPRWEAGELHAVTLACGEARGVKLGKAQAPIRVAATGKSVGPPLFESLEVLGRDEVLGRLRAALARLGT